MKSNADLQKDVQDAIKWEPILSAAQIGVTAKDGVVTLTGTVDSYAKKQEAENAAKNVAGVTAIAEEITVRFGSESKKDDTEIATSAVNALKWNWSVPNDKVKVKVQNGWISLDGELGWNYQREAAHDAVRWLTGVMGVTNNLTIKADTHDKIEKKAVEDALARNWSINNLDINVSVSGTKVTLSGTVPSLYQKDEVTRIVWATPGIWNVQNDLIVDYSYALID
jgi:osmotically-inducible protein OsmY